MLREVVQEPILRNIRHHDTSRQDLREWNIQMYYEAMGMDLMHDDDYVEE